MSQCARRAGVYSASEVVEVGLALVTRPRGATDTDADRLSCTLHYRMLYSVWCVR